MADPGFLARLLTPSPVMSFLLGSLPLLICAAGLAGARRGIAGAARLGVLALLLALWLWLPLAAPLLAVPFLTAPTGSAATISAGVSVMAWFGLIALWLRQVLEQRPDPVWLNIWVGSHLGTIVIAAFVALIRAMLSS